MRAFLAFFALAQPVTLIGVFSWITAPFCAVKAVGISSDEDSVSRTLRVTVFVWPLAVSFTLCLTRAVLVGLHRFPFAASAENDPSGSVSSNVPTGTSGIVWKVELVIPALLMNVSECRSTVTP